MHSLGHARPDLPGALGATAPVISDIRVPRRLRAPRVGGIWRRVSDRVVESVLEPGEILLCEGDAPVYLYEVRSGWLKLECFLEDGSYRIVRLAGAGDAVGLEALFDEVSVHRVAALTPCVVDKVPLGELRHKLRTDQALFQDICLHWRNDMMRAEAVLTRYTVGPARHRLARLILDLCGRGAEQARTRIMLPPGEDIAALISATKETVSRNLSALIRSGALEKLRDKMVLVTPERIRAALD